MPPGSKDPANMNTFLDAIVRSGLLDSDQLQQEIKHLSQEQRGDVQSLADQLIKRGKLSSFQAKKLMKGAFGGLLLGPYEVVAPIGKGGMGTVYLARDMNLQKLIALKILPPKKAKQNERMLMRFQRELEINQRVAHPHIAWTYQGGMIQGVFYIAMEFIPGKTLSRLVNDKGPLDVARLAQIAVEVCLGLHHAHTQGVIHRDLKPSNIMITPNNHAKVLDMGLALIKGEAGGLREVIGGQGYVVGSMDYIAPEQIKDAAGVDARADVYGLGCTFYYALTGRPPFPGGTAKEKMHRHRKEEHPPLRSLRSSIPEGFAAIIHKMMAKNPEDRYQSMKEVREAMLPWMTADAELPMDQSGDRSFQEVIQALTTADVDSEMVNDTIIGKNSTDDSIKVLNDGNLARWLTMDEQQRGYVLLCAGIIGFWFLVLLVLGLVLLLR